MEKEIESLVLEQVNLLLVAENKEPMRERTGTLIGIGGVLDSLDLISLVTAVERAVSQQYGVSISLSDERVLEQETLPFGSVDALARYCLMLIDEKIR